MEHSKISILHPWHECSGTNGNYGFISILIKAKHAIYNHPILSCQLSTIPHEHIHRERDTWLGVSAYIEQTPNQCYVRKHVPSMCSGPLVPGYRNKSLILLTIRSTNTWPRTSQTASGRDYRIPTAAETLCFLFAWHQLPSITLTSICLSCWIGSFGSFFAQLRPMSLGLRISKSSTYI